VVDNLIEQFICPKINPPNKQIIRRKKSQFNLLILKPNIHLINKTSAAVGYRSFCQQSADSYRQDRTSAKG